MKALITAAGMGTRLGGLTKNTNKCLLKVGGRSLLKKSLDNLNKNGINEIVVITGHAFDKVGKEFKGKALFVYNPFYRISGILPSIWLARDYIGHEEFIFVTADSIYHTSVLKKCIEAKGDIVICVKKKRCDAEDSKVIIEKKRIINVGKDIKEKAATGEFMGMVKISKRACKIFFTEVDKLLKEGRLNTYVADVLVRLMKKGVDLNVVYTGNKPYIEIDTPGDLKRARKIFK
ncbi:MAG: phosphocholine cytidylyltransferase family protein [Candidatus Omnitrophota bacterium]